MTLPIKLMTTLPLVALFTGCVAGGNDVVNTTSEIEQTTDQDIDGDGLIKQGGVPVAAGG